MTERAGQARRAMVQALERFGHVHDPAVLDAMARVPREWFVPRFWTFPAHRTPPVREWRVDDPEEGEAALRLVYDIDRALAIRVGPADRVTATISAPTIVGSMLELLDLRPGIRVLEIGAGSGYNAALLRELVGARGAVTSVDIDGGLVKAADVTLRAGGWADVVVIAGDGYAGAPERAPFDRVVATVGCADLAPAWLQQLAPGGSCLLPLQHDGWHPLTRIIPLGGRATGEVLGRSGFVAIQGHQSDRSPWSGHTPPLGRMHRCPLPATLANGLPPGPDGDRQPALWLWDLAYLVSLEDRRATSMTGLSSADSLAAIDPSRGDVVWSGPAGPQLRDQLIALAHRWVALGGPSLADWRSVFVPLAMDPPVFGERRWIIDRIDFRQIVTLP